MAEEKIEKFQPTNGRVVGVLGLAVVLALMVLGAIDGYPVWGVGLLAVVAVLTWASVLRPGVRIIGDQLELRNMFATQLVPLGAIEEVVVRRVLAVRAGERRFVSPAISRSLRQTLHPKIRKGGQQLALAATSYPDFVEERIRAAAQDHRDRLGIRARSSEQQALADVVRTDPALPELAALALAVLVLVAGFFIAL
jgi:hypothetical protein